MATVPLQICNGTDKCCKKFIILYSLFSLLSLHFFFSLLSHSPVPSLFSLYQFPLSSEVKLPRPTRVKNKTPAPIQITAEHILREARERQEAEIRPPKQKITGATELSEYRPRSISHARSHPRSSHARSCRSHPEAAVDPLPSPLCPPFTLPLFGCGFFFFTVVWVNLMVVVDCGLWAVTVAVVVEL